MARKQEPIKLAYKEMNRTELVQLLMFNEIPGASLALPRKTAIHILKLMEEAQVQELLAFVDSIGARPMDQFRDKISAWLIRYWDKMEMQVPNPQCPNCHASCDAQVAMCWLDNHHQIT